MIENETNYINPSRQLPFPQEEKPINVTEEFKKYGLQPPIKIPIKKDEEKPPKKIPIKIKK